MSLRKEIALALVIKVVLLYVIWEIWFDRPISPDARQHMVERAIIHR